MSDKCDVHGVSWCAVCMIRYRDDKIDGLIQRSIEDSDTIVALRAELRAAKMAYESAEWPASRQTAAYQSAMAHAEKCDAVCRLAVRVKEAAFDDPGDAVRWGEAVNDFEESL